MSDELLYVQDVSEDEIQHLRPRAGGGGVRWGNGRGQKLKKKLKKSINYI